jgi:UDP-N-acetylmuramoyl-tripeptide--D-alanyl-D-alanine ligase
MTLAEIAQAVRGQLVPHGDATEATVVSGVSDTDSRNIGAGDIFFAKPGEVTDGHLFAGRAVAQGAALVVAERELADAPAPHGRLRVIAVTGSNGKTTTKNLLREIFSRRGNVVAPIGSFNNEVGAPTTFLQVTEETDWLIAEMGASGIGHIARLARMAPPDVAIELMVGLAHAGEFGGIENVELAKAELVEALGEGGIAVLNADDPRVARMAAKAPGRVVWFGRGQSAEVRAEEVSVASDGTRFTLVAPGETPEQVHFPVIGEHHVMNALAATAAAHAVGVPVADVADVLREVTLAEHGRMEVLTREPITVINDAYNANPNSMAAALRTLAQIADDGQRKVAVLGAMAELGEFSVAEHDKLGELAVRLDINRIVVVGRDARPLYLAAVAQGSWDNEASFSESADEAFELLTRELREGDLVLVKASKSSGLNDLANRLGDHVKGRLS